MSFFILEFSVFLYNLLLNLGKLISSTFVFEITSLITRVIAIENIAAGARHQSAGVPEQTPHAAERRDSPAIPRR